MKYFDCSCNAKGFIAIGSIAVGFVAIGVNSVGVIAIGVNAVGVISCGLGLSLGLLFLGTGVSISVLTPFGLGVTVPAVPCELFFGVCIPEVSPAGGLLSMVFFFLICCWCCLRARRLQYDANFSPYNLDTDSTQIELEDSVNMENNNTSVNLDCIELVDVAYLLRNTGNIGKVCGNIKKFEKGRIIVDVYEYGSTWTHSMQVSSDVASKIESLQNEVVNDSKSCFCCPTKPKYVFTVQGVEFPIAKSSDVDMAQEQKDKKAKVHDNKSVEYILDQEPFNSILECIDVHIANESENIESADEVTGWCHLKSIASRSNFKLAYWENSRSTVSFVAFVCFLGLLLSSVLCALQLKHVLNAPFFFR